MLKLGAQNISALYLGGREIKRAYLGENLVFGPAPVQAYTITATIDPPGAGTVTGDGEYEAGKQATMTATPNEGYRFVHWTDDGSRLPTGYTELEYIQSNGTQYIDTEFYPDSNTRVVADFQFTSVGSNASIFGARISSRDGAYQVMVTGRKYRSDYGEYITQVWDSVDASERNIVDKDAGTTTIHGISKSYENVQFEVGFPMYIFSCNQKGTPQFIAPAILYSLDIYDSGEQVRNYVPCRSLSGAIGLYDTVDNKFYGNAGTGEFTPGPAVQG